jgi:hypothetical protein
METMPETTAKPSLELPQGIDRAEVHNFLDFVTAGLIRFGRHILRRPDTPILRTKAGVLCDSKKFQKARVNQWAHQLDRGNLVNFKVNMAASMGICEIEDALFAWARDVQPDSVPWNTMLPRVALGCTILAEGMAMTRAAKHCSSTIPADNLQQMSQAIGKAAPIVFPFGRALNGISVEGIRGSLTGRWL